MTLYTSTLILLHPSMWMDIVMWINPIAWLWIWSPCTNNETKEKA